MVTAKSRPPAAPSADELDHLGGLSPLGGLEAIDEVEEPPGSPRLTGKAASPPLGLRTAYARWAAAKVDAAEVRVRKASRELKREVMAPVWEEVAPSWDATKRWRTCIESVWRWPTEHINVKEMRVCLMSLRRAARQPGSYNTRLLTLSDSMASTCALDEGRSQSWGLNALGRRAAAFQLGCSITWRVRHNRTHRNAADEGSRRGQKQVSSGPPAKRGAAPSPLESKQADAPSPKEPREERRTLLLEPLVPPPGFHTADRGNEGRRVIAPEAVSRPPFLDGLLKLRGRGSSEEEDATPSTGPRCRARLMGRGVLELFSGAGATHTEPCCAASDRVWSGTYTSARPLGYGASGPVPMEASAVSTAGPRARPTSPSSVAR